MFRNNLDPTLFTSPLFETANMTVLHAREVLEQTGMTEAARRLEGVEVTDANTARVALDILQELKMGAEVVYARDTAVNLLRKAIQS